MVIHVSCTMTKGQNFSNLHTEVSLGGFQLHQGLFLDLTVIIEFLGEGSPVCPVMDVVEQ